MLVKNMKIIKYKKKKSNIYELLLDNNSKLDLYDDIILKYELLLKKEINDKELSKIILDNSYLEGYYVALKYINIRLRTEKEIRNKLKNYNKNIIDNIVSRLKKEGYINNSLYIKSYINDEVNLKFIGPVKILSDLKKNGFKEDDILEYLNTIDNNIWLEKINKYVTKRIDSNHNLSGLLLKQKIVKDLLNKGFYIEDINEIINTYDFYDNDEIYQKEYTKIKKRLIKKYDDSKLDYYIKMELLKKGFKKNSDF